MSGIYIHIPFCRQACHYCDFHFSTNLQRKGEIVKAICQEIVLQKDYLPTSTLQTIYLGGGTPSLLNQNELEEIFHTIYQYFKVDKNAEITLEANPDDLTQENLSLFKQIGINRLSIGIQSFDVQHLQFLHRIHTQQEAINCVKVAQDVGFNNISIDLIYAIPSENHAIWHADLQKAIDLQVKHISAYCLTIEPQTVFGNWLHKGKLKPIVEDFAAEQFEILVDFLGEQGFVQYEVSNFCLPGLFSKHNSNYWRNIPYLGIGPAAHSYNGINRQYNVSHNAKYLAAIQQNSLAFTVDVLTPESRANEYLMTHLRTMWGVDLEEFRKLFSIDLGLTQKEYLQDLLREELIYLDKNIIRLTRKGMLLADKIAGDLFIL